MNRDRFISVIIPTYNRAPQLITSVNSVLAQTHREFEIVVVDDGSIDSTAQTIQTIVNRTHDSGSQLPRIRYFYQSNKGQSVARNKGVAEAIGEWIAFLDSDDRWLPEKLEWQVRAIERFKDNCGACFTDACLVDGQGLDTTAFRKAGREYKELVGVVRDPTRSLAKAFGGTWVQTLVARRDLIMKIGGFDSDLHFGEDYDLLFRLSLVTGYCYVNRPLAVIDRTTAVLDPTVASRSWDRIDFRLRGRQYMYEKWLNLRREYPRDVRRTIIHNLRGVHSGWTNWYLENKQFDKARRAVSKATKYHMTPQLAVKWLLTWIAPHIARRIIPKTAAML
jgi:glycosyltransferase involved in cell wall biosynthesis